MSLAEGVGFMGNGMAGEAGSIKERPCHTLR